MLQKNIFYYNNVYHVHFFLTYIHFGKIGSYPSASLYEKKSRPPPYPFRSFFFVFRTCYFENSAHYLSCSAH